MYDAWLHNAYLTTRLLDTIAGIALNLNARALHHYYSGPGTREARTVVTRNDVKAT